MNGKEIPLSGVGVGDWPHLADGAKLTRDSQAVLAMLAGWNGSQRQIVGMLECGAIYTVNPPSVAICNREATADSQLIQLPNTPTGQTIIKAYHSNIGTVWVSIRYNASVGTGFPLEAGEWLPVTIKNLNGLYVFFEKDNDGIAVLVSE